MSSFDSLLFLLTKADMKINLMIFVIARLSTIEFIFMSAFVRRKSSESNDDIS
jgi:hypothetical protein